MSFSCYKHSHHAWQLPLPTHLSNHYRRNGLACRSSNPDKQIREQIIALINREVVPAVGCTEPMCVSLCVARATETLGFCPEKITVLLSSNILKNAMGVGIPGTGMIGLPIAVALGALVGKSEYQLEVLKDLTPETLEKGKQYINGNHIDIRLKSGITEKLYVEVRCEAEGHVATAIIAHAHTNFVFVERDGVARLDNRKPAGKEADNDDIILDMRMVHDFSTTTPLDEIRFILKTREYNMRAAAESKKGNYGHCLGKTIDRPMSHGIFGNSIFSHIISATALACDARMGGAMIPVIVMLLKSKINIKFYKIFMFTIAGAFVIVYLYRMFIGTGDIVVFEPQNNILFRIIRKLNL